MSRIDPVEPPMPFSEPVLALSTEMLGRLMPMFLWLDARGRIRGMGPTLARIVGPGAAGGDFARHFTLRRARGVEQSREAAFSGRRLGLTLVRYPMFNLRGLAVPLGPGEQADVLVNLSFGIQLSEAVRYFGLTEADFAASDLAMEFLFLAEAKAAVLGELTALTGRLQLAKAEAETEAQLDPLTGLANRRAFDAAMSHAIKSAARGRRNFALLHLDLDYFKQVNDTLGHAAGDTMLVRAAHVLRDEVRRGDLVARLGGDEFIILLRGPVERGMIESMAERLIARIEEPVSLDGVDCRISASIGVSIALECRPILAEELMAEADAALYQSKRAGRGRWTIAPLRFAPRPQA
ncbi:diguanylate cyclase (GGDEF)-like protein [Rhodobacter viridis]|uniref:Diguanylate cyclase (GGDEF)-like protein n=1 Tax=Rhodobacter viridis TaxID=1054202 RepID=A0A318TYF8_9RHOB|nr:GGDEF domain-containing protein [Rhodobacter viridis]PYF09799.1 diguanylate cyclase (GGDEF)-like protein [Rhodobacter viridis]